MVSFNWTFVFICILISVDVYLDDIPKVKGVEPQYRLKKEAPDIKSAPLTDDYQIDYSDGTIDSNYENDEEPKAVSGVK